LAPETPASEYARCVPEKSPDKPTTSAANKKRKTSTQNRSREPDKKADKIVLLAHY